MPLLYYFFYFIIIKLKNPEDKNVEGILCSQFIADASLKFLNLSSEEASKYAEDSKSSSSSKKKTQKPNTTRPKLKRQALKSSLLSSFSDNQVQFHKTKKINNPKQQIENETQQDDMEKPLSHSEFIVRRIFCLIF